MRQAPAPHPSRHLFPNYAAFLSRWVALARAEKTPIVMQPVNRAPVGAYHREAFTMNDTLTMRRALPGEADRVMEILEDG